MKIGLNFFLSFIHNIAKSAVPGFALLIPLSSLLRISRAIRVVLGHEIEVDWKFSDIDGLRASLRELAEVAIYKTEKEILEAIYALLCYVTTLEDNLTLEQFMIAANDSMDAAAEETPGVPGAVALFPSANVQPTDSKGDALCAPMPVASA